MVRFSTSFFQNLDSFSVTFVVKTSHKHGKLETTTRPGMPRSWGLFLCRWDKIQGDVRPSFPRCLVLSKFSLSLAVCMASQHWAETGLLGIKLVGTELVP